MLSEYNPDFILFSLGLKHFVVPDLDQNILIIAENIDVESSSGAKGRVALIKNLYKAGFSVQVYHYSRKEVQLEGIPCFSIREKRRNLLFLISRIERNLRYKFKFSLNPVIERAFGFSFTLLNDRNSIVKILKKIDDSEFDLILTLSQGGSFRPHHALLKLPKWHYKWYAYIHDPYPMHSFPRPYDWVEPGHEKKRVFFKKIAGSAKAAVYPSQLLAEWMEGYYPALIGKRLIVPHQIVSELMPIDKAEDLMVENKFNILHAGNLLDKRNPFGLLQAFELFLKKNPIATAESKLIFIGPPSPFHSLLVEKTKTVPQVFVNRENVLFNTALRLTQRASVNVILEAKSNISPFLPGKFPHCIRAEKPILLLGPPVSESRRLLGEEYPWWAEIDDVDRISVILEELYNAWKHQEGWLRMQREDLINYMGPEYLKKIFRVNSITNSIQN